MKIATISALLLVVLLGALLLAVSAGSNVSQGATLASDTGGNARIESGKPPLPGPTNPNSSVF
jgi:hypothetical protein